MTEARGGGFVVNATGLDRSSDGFVLSSGSAVQVEERRVDLRWCSVDLVVNPECAAVLWCTSWWTRDVPRCIGTNVGGWWRWRWYEVRASFDRSGRGKTVGFRWSMMLTAEEREAPTPTACGRERWLRRSVVQVGGTVGFPCCPMALVANPRWSTVVTAADDGFADWTSLFPSSSSSFCQSMNWLFDGESWGLVMVECFSWFWVEWWRWWVA